MPNISKAERERRAAESPAPKAPEKLSPELVQMSKGSQMLSVHKSCVKAHQSAGWTVKES